MFLQYLKIGFEHVIPLGYDHLLFIIALFFFNSNLKTAILQCSIFTIAHSITLALGTLGIFKLEPSIVETLIAFSIFLVAIENKKNKELKRWRIVVIFCFGLIHGMGFASALTENGLPSSEIFIALLGFNFGVEIAQLLIIASCYLLVARSFSKANWYDTKLVSSINIIISCIALFWTVERILSN